VTESEALNNLQVTLFGSFFDEIKQLAALGNHRKQAPTRGKILLVGFEMLGEMGNPLSKEGHLVRCAASVSFVELIFFQVDFVFAHGLRGWIQQLPERPWLGLSAEENPDVRVWQDNCPDPGELFAKYCHFGGIRNRFVIDVTASHS